MFLQLAGHLRGRALQEWELLEEGDKETFSSGVDALRARLDPVSKTLAAQDFRHTSQRDDEGVNSFIRRLERTFRIAYGRDKLVRETRAALLYGQLHEGLKYDIMKAPTVSGAQSYETLCVAAKNEERKLAELRKRQQYRKAGSQWSQPLCRVRKLQTPSPLQSSHPSQRGTARSATKQNPPVRAPQKVDPLDLLLSDSEDETIRLIRLTDKGSVPQGAKVLLQRVPAVGIIDSGADITIVGSKLFRKVATVAWLKKRDFYKPDKSPRTYDQNPFSLDGRMNLDITFDGKTMTTAVYVKMDAYDELLLSEGVCRQLGILSYHEEVQPLKGTGSGLVGVMQPKTTLMRRYRQFG